MEANINYGEVKLIVIYNYQEGEDQDWEYPGSAPEVEVESVFAEDSEIDLFNIFTYVQLEDIEDMILELKRDY